MFEIKVPSVKFQFDVEGFKTDFRAFIVKTAKGAAVEFAKAALSRIPIHTGFVAGSFGTLTDLLGSQGRFNPIVAFTRRIEFYNGVRKTPTSGRQFATPDDKIFTWSGDIYQFQFDVDISYYRINDSTSGRSPTAPWNSFIAAQAAFEAYMAKNLIKPDLVLEKYLVVG